MTTEKSAARFPWVALVLSFLSSGVGHMYCGRIVKGLMLYSARLLLPLLCIVAAFMQPSNSLFVGLILLPAAATLIIFFYSAVDAWALAKRCEPDYSLKEYNRASVYWSLVAVQLAFLIVVTLGVRAFAFEAYVIPTRSMSPSILAGDRVLVNKRPLTEPFPERGDVVVFRAPAEERATAWVKRVIAVAGDEVVLRGQDVEVNGEPLRRERVPQESLAELGDQIEGRVFDESHDGRRYRIVLSEEKTEATEEVRLTVPERSIFVMGDNRDRSRDSREIGAVHVSDVIGYVDYVFFPA